MDDENKMSHSLVSLLNLVQAEFPLMAYLTRLAEKTYMGSTESILGQASVSHTHPDMLHLIFF